LVRSSFIGRQTYRFGPRSSVRPRPEERCETAAVPTVALTMTQCWHRVPGGSATSVLGLRRALVAHAGAEVRTIAVGPAGTRWPLDAWAIGPPVVRLPLPLRPLYEAWALDGRPGVSGAVPEADLVHVTVPIAPRRGARPMVATVHDLLPLDRPEDLTRRGVRLMRRGLDRIRDEADLVVVPTRVVADRCVAHGFEPERVRVVPWGAAPVDPTPEAIVAARDRFGLRGPTVVYLGTLEPRKGLRTLARAMGALGRPEVTLVLVGPAGWGDAVGAELAGVPGPVVATGFVDPGDLPAVLAGASVFAYPSEAEGFGLPVLEAMAAGAPVITSAGGATDEVAAGAALTVESGDHVALAGDLARVLDDADLAEHLRGAGRRRAAELSWARTAAGYLAAYQDVLS
jgi:glycosyltransferase involved in cell wall biosynthesis